ncbi:peptidylprolyl isomerase [Mariprofundus erugo]|uniref:Peptidyl-prolyl cis-trans isomerase n=1 Tax=Mariprofundus erugo TaxID=2528639 RepID=A0A5R9GT01_9PROT|nr:peptidylprolyl isomerase [Mariprofundus erugo]TLS67222.1 peptidylprolyl isomerase [Mariprofundus erugo]TLS76478.1 peptidylprolyl isomerase [Mariprofundus erugo]
MKIDHHKVVSFQYSLSNDAGEILDASEAGDPLVYLHGEENIIPGLERALEGKSVGDKLKVSLEADDAYGEYDPELVEVVSSEMFPGVENIEVGMEFQAAPEDDEDEDADFQFVRVTRVDGDQITVDGNHQFAGMRLHFDVTIEAIREATEEEIEHGHVHGDEGCCEEDCDEDECCGGGCCN